MGSIYYKLNMANKKVDAIRDSQKLNTTTSNIGAVIVQLRVELQKLNDEIKADKDGLFEYENQLKSHISKKKDVEKAIAAHKKFIKNNDDVILGPTQKIYNDLQKKYLIL